MNTTVRVASVASAIAVASPALAITEAHGDVELRLLWADYLSLLDAHNTARDAHDPLRATYDAENGALRESLDWKEWQDATADLFDKHGLRPTWDAVCAASDALSAIVENIRAVPAETTFGLGVKLAAQPLYGSFGADIDDYNDAILAALADVDRQTGANFSEIAADNHEPADVVDGLSEPPNAILADPDPVFAAIEKHRHLVEEFNRLDDELDRDEADAKSKFGQRPWDLIAWRDYSAISGSEIDRARDEFLAECPEKDRARHVKQVEREYKEAKARERAAKRAGRSWDKRAGLADLRKRCEQTRSAERAAANALAKTTPRTAPGAGALVSYSREWMEIGDCDWHLPALETAAKALATMDARSLQSV